MSKRKSTKMRKSSGIAGWQVLKDRDFRLLWGSQAVSQVADGLIRVALIWFVYKLTGSAMKMTVIGLLQTIPPLLLSPLIGVYLDRLPKKPVMIVVDILRAVLLVLIPILHAMDALTLNGLYALVFLTAVAFTALGPALSASVPLLVERSQLTSANALIQSTATMGVILGPVISGPGIAWVGAQNMLYVGAPAFLIAAALLVPIEIRETQNKVKRAEQKSVLHDMLVGMRYAWTQQPMIRLLVITSALHSLVASAFVFLLPVFADKSLGAGSVELGWLWSAYGGGMLAAAAWLTFAKQHSADARIYMVGIALACGGAAAGALAFIPALIAAMLLNTVIGISLGMFTPVIWGLLQESVPAELRGRVFAMVNTVAMSASLVGMMAFGWSVETYGPQTSLIAMGLTLLATSIMAMQLKRQCRPRALEKPAQATTG